MRLEVLGIGFDSLTLDEAAQRGYELMGSEGTSYVVTVNPEMVYDSMSDSEHARILNGADLVLPDGIGIIYGARILKRPLAERVPGVEFAQALMELMAKDGKRLYLFGSKPGIAQAAGEKLSSAYPGLVICGCHDGYFSDDGPIIDDINNSKADCVFVCLGAPKQEKWMGANIQKVNTGLMIGLGGCLDVFSGVSKRAPKIFCDLGLEWLYRLIKEPWRFKRMTKLPRFLIRVINARIKHTGD